MSEGRALPAGRDGSYDVVKIAVHQADALGYLDEYHDNHDRNKPCDEDVFQPLVLPALPNDALKQSSHPSPPLQAAGRSADRVRAERVAEECIDRYGGQI